MEAADSVFELYPVLTGIDVKIRQRVAEQMQVMTVPAGTVLFDEQQPCTGFPFLIKGAVRVLKAAANGRELPLYRVLPGETCIISSSCLLGHIAYNARGIAQGETSLVLLPRPLFDELMNAPTFRDFIFQLFAERMADLMQLVEEVAFRKLDQRLAALLLGKGKLVHATHQQLADELGSVREMVSRLLKGFADLKLVTLGREQIEILDPSRLREVAAGIK